MSPSGVSARPLGEVVALVDVGEQPRSRRLPAEQGPGDLARHRHVECQQPCEEAELAVGLRGLERGDGQLQSGADRLAGDWRLICPSFRGRAESAPAKDPATYVPLTYVGDILALLDELALDRVAIIGTSLGGIVAMLMAMLAPDRVAGAVLNDIGPVIEQQGLGTGDRGFPRIDHRATQR